MSAVLTVPTRSAPLAALLLLSPFGLLGACARAPEPPDPEHVAESADWRRIETAKRELDGLRARLEASAPSGREDAPTALEREVQRKTDELSHRLTEFLNDAAPREGEPLSELSRRAVALKSAEDLRLAESYLQEAADPAAAIEILEAALSLDPTNPELRGALERTRAARFMTAARFAKLRDGMTTDEVTAALGTPNPHDVRDYPARGVVGWFYPKDESGAAAAVWFERKGGTLVVYRSDFSALGPSAPDDRGVSGDEDAAPPTRAPSTAPDASSPPGAAGRLDARSPA